MTEDPEPPQVFVTTRWSMVLHAGRADTERSREALEELCRQYWHPLYHYVRHRGSGPEDARDLTQAFFARLLERQVLGRVSRERGRFRSFLVAALKNFLADEWDKGQAQKRGAGRVFPFDFEREERLMPEPADAAPTPDQAYERRWALSLLDQVYRKLEGEYRAQAKGELFAIIRVTLTAPRGTCPYAELARECGMTEGAIKVAVHRLRMRYRELLRQSIAETVESEGEVDDELMHLRRVLG